jgi:hypothetical protein
MLSVTEINSSRTITTDLYKLKSQIFGKHTLGIGKFISPKRILKPAVHNAIKYYRFAWRRVIGDGSLLYAYCLS